MAKKKVEQEQEATEQTQDERSHSLLIASLEKILGKGAVATLDNKRFDLEFIETDYIGFNLITGGGFARRRIHEIFSAPGCGKSWMALHGLYKVQQAGKRGLFIDAERALNRRFVEMANVDPHSLEVVTPSCGEEGFSVLETALLSGIYDMIVIDSVHAMMPKAMMDAEPGEAKMMELARLFSNELPKVRDAFSSVETSIVFINQMRYKPNPMGHGPGKTTPGGDALPFYADCRVQMTKTESLKTGDNTSIGHMVECKGVKSRFTSPNQICKLDFVYGQGFCKYRELINYSIEYGIMKQAGAWFSYNDEKIGQGRAQAIELLKSDQDLFEKIKKETLEKIFI